MDILKKGKAIVGVTNAFGGAFVKAYKIGAFKEPPRDILPKYIRVFCRKVCQSFGVEVIEVEPIPQTHGLWASNHVSWLDVPVSGFVSPVFFLSKAEIENWPIVGTLAKAGGTLFINRGSGDAGNVATQLAKFLKEGSSVVFFPEATTTNGHKIKKMHGKLLQASMQTGLPIMPMVLCYTDEHGNISEAAAYYGNKTMKESLKAIMASKKLKVYVQPLEPLYPEDKTQQELTDILFERMQAGLVDLQKKVLKTKPADAVWDEYES